MTDQNKPTPMLDFSTQNENVLRPKRARIPITRVFTSALFAVLILFVLVTLLAYFRLFDFRIILSDITEKSVPSMAISSQIYSQVNTLTYLSEGLARAPSDATRRITEKRINEQIAVIRSLANEEFSDPYLQVQLSALSLELDELNDLIKLRLLSEKMLREKQQSMYRLYDQTLNLAEKDAKLNIDSGRFTWTLTVSDIVALAGKATSLNRLHVIRQIAEQISIKLVLLEIQVSELSTSQRATAKQLTSSLREILVGESGLISLQIEQLQISGRSTGRGNFVRNLILDYASLAELQSYQINASVISETQIANAQVKEQIRIIGVASVIAILFLIAVVFYLRNRVVLRLNKLKIRVENRLEGRKSPIRIGGNDEISDISHTFDLFAKTIEEQNKILHDLSLSDGLTGIANRRSLDERLLYEIKQARRHKWSVSVLLIDVDFFKLYNDKYGHNNGDECLKRIAKVLNQQMQRNGDFVARFGGEEFVCILPDTQQHGASSVAQILLEEISAENILHEFSTVAQHVTVSIGVATCNYDQSENVGPLLLLKMADQALYGAKANGRNQFVCFDDK